MLEQDPDEALVGAHQRPVDHHRPVLGVVRAGVGQTESLREVVVELNGSQLPRASERVGHVHVDLRPVEGTVALVEVVLELLARESLQQRLLAVIPQLVRADPLIGSGRELEPNVDPEHLVGRERELQARGHLLLDLLLRAEDVSVVLGEVTHSQQSVEGAARLAAVQQSRLRVADGKIAIGVLLQE